MVAPGVTVCPTEIVGLRELISDLVGCGMLPDAVRDEAVDGLRKGVS